MNIDAETDLGDWFVGVNMDVQIWFEPSDRSVGICASFSVDRIYNEGLYVSWYDNDGIFREWKSNDAKEVDQAMEVIQWLNKPLFAQLEEAIDEAIDSGIEDGINSLD